MAAETASLIIKVDSSGAKRASDDLDKLTGAAGKAEKQTGVLTSAWKMLGTVAASAALAQAATTYIRLADASANMSARLRLATRSQEEFNRAHAETYNIAQRTSTELGSVVDLYAKLSQSTGQLGVSQSDLLQLTETITQTFQISGATAQEASGGLRQLSQAMAGGVLRAEEFNSIIESSPRLVQAMADGMGIAFGDVRKYVNDGKISSEELVKALLSQSRTIESEFGEMPLTVGRAVQEVRNALTRLVGDTDNAAGASADLAKAVQDLARTLESEETKAAFATLIGGIASVGSIAAEAIGWLGQLDAKVRESLGLIATGPTRNAGGQDVLGGWRTGFGALMSGDLEGAMRGQQRMIQGLRGVWNNSGQVANFTRVTGDVMRPSFAGVTGSVTSDSAAAVRAYEEAEKKSRSARKALTEEEKAAQALARALESYNARLHEANTLINDQSELAKVNYEIQYGSLRGITEAQAAALREAAEWLEFQKDMAALEEVWAEGRQEATDQWIASQAKATQEVSEFARQAARNMQDAFADFLYDPFADGVDGMVKRFADALRRMAADLAASKILEMVGQWASGYTGAGSGWINAIGGVMQSGGQRASGGPVQAGQGYIVGDGGKPELFVPGQSGRVFPMGSGGMSQPVVNLNVIGAPSTPETSVRPNGSGGFDMEIIFKQIEGRMAQSLDGGALGAVGKARFGWREAM